MKNTKVQLYGLTTSGKVKTLILEVKGDNLVTTWGQLGGAMQTTSTKCDPTNSGRANSRDGHEQALFEFAATEKKKREQGYVDDPKLLRETIVNAEVSLDDLPESFCPSKPISKCPTKVENDPNTFAQRKMNGNCIILAKNGGNKVFSRTMKDLTKALSEIPPIVKAFETMNKGQMINCEMVYIGDDKKESTATLGSLVRTQDPEEAMEKYKAASKEGKFVLWVFDIIFDKNKFVGNLEYLERYELMNKYGFNTPTIIKDWKKYVKYENGTAKGTNGAENWEGFVLRVPGKSQITYTLNGKADRAGAYKFKFMKEGDFIVTGVEYGKGKFAEVYAVFNLALYKDGELIDCGNAGPGILTMPELTEYTSEINSGKLPLPFVVEIEFRDWQEEGYKLEHPVIQRIRWDKTPEECIYES